MKSHLNLILGPQSFSNHRLELKFLTLHQIKMIQKRINVVDNWSNKVQTMSFWCAKVFRLPDVDIMCSGYPFQCTLASIMVQRCVTSWWQFLVSLLVWGHRQTIFPPVSKLWCFKWGTLEHWGLPLSKFWITILGFNLGNNLPSGIGHISMPNHEMIATL
jgi:hypothetical protein